MAYKLVPKSEYIVVGQGERAGKKGYHRAGGYGPVLPKCILCYEYIRHKRYPLVAIPQNNGELGRGLPAHPCCVEEYLRGRE